MATRIDVELTSSRDDGTWTWRAAGARQPKGEVSSTLLYEGAKVGDTCRVDADVLLDGIEILEVFAPKQKRDRLANVLEMKTRQYSDDELVSEVRASRSKSGRDGKKGGRDGKRGAKRGGREAGRGRDGGRNQKRVETELRPKPKRLRPRRTHRDAVLAEVSEEHRPIAEQVMRGGIPAVRSAIEKQNTESKEQGKPEMPVEPVLSIAEPLVPLLRTAEWRDRADSALSILGEVDLRDLRSVVVASDAAARDPETRALADQLKTGLSERIESDHNQWLTDLSDAMTEGRTVRGLRLSSRPVKAGAPLPPEVAEKLAQAASVSLSGEITQDRWATVLDAVAFSPIRSAVTPSGYPAEPDEKLLEAVRRVADRVPAIAAHFGIDPAEAAKANKRRRPARKGKKTGTAKKPSDAKASPKQAPEAKASAGKAPEAKTPEAKAPEAKTPEAKAPEAAAASSEPTAQPVATESAPAAPVEVATQATDAAVDTSTAPEAS